MDMGFRVVYKSCVTFETDLPPSSRNIHPSGILQASRPTPPASTRTKPSGSICSNGSNINREENTFAWIANSLHIESALSLLEKRGFDRREGIVFIPYSTKRNWLDRYPHAVPALECTEGGRCEVDENWSPHSDGSGGPRSSAADDGGETSVCAEGIAVSDARDDTLVKKRKYKYKSRTLNILQDNSYIPDAERDELHIEIYNYLSWLHAKLTELEVKGAESTEVERIELAVPSPSQGAMGKDEVNRDSKTQAAVAKAARPKNNNGVDVSELHGVLEKLEAAFAIIPNIKFEAAAHGAIGMQQQQQQQQIERGEQQRQQTQEEVGKNRRPRQQHRQQVSTTARASREKGAPFLEQALSGVLSQLVAAREMEGKPRRRSRKKHRVNSGNPNRQHSRAAGDFDEIFQRLVRYKEEYGHCCVPRSYEDQKLSNWVNGIRDKKSKLQREGIEFEEVPPGRKILAKTLTVERVERLDSIGFAWSVAGPKVAWEDRFRECMEYYENNGKWPSQSMGSLGIWVHRQRQAYAKRDVDFIKTRAPKLDEVGFEWTPRGNTRLAWDEGFEMLMEYGKINGHYDVKCPIGNSEEVNKKSDEYRLYRWVESLHAMYRSYKLGRQSGSLTDERVVLLIKHGFAFRNDH